MIVRDHDDDDDHPGQCGKLQHLTWYVQIRVNYSTAEMFIEIEIISTGISLLEQACVLLSSSGEYTLVPAACKSRGRATLHHRATLHFTPRLLSYCNQR